MAKTSLPVLAFYSSTGDSQLLLLEPAGVLARGRLLLLWVPGEHPSFIYGEEREGKPGRSEKNSTQSSKS